MEFIEEKLQTPVSMTTDVVIAGGGPAGFIAALAAARNGASVVLIEKYSFIASNITNGPLEAMMTFHDSLEQIIGGIPQEFINRLIKAGGSPGHVPDDVGYCKTITPFDAEILKWVTLQMLSEAGVTVLFQTMLVNVVKVGYELKGVVIENKSGRQMIQSKMVIDCTGDADLCSFAGVDFEKGRPSDGLTQPITLMFKVGGVNMDRLIQYVKETPGQFMFGRDPQQLNEESVMHLWGFKDVLEEGYSMGKLSLKRKELHLASTIRKGEVIINFTRVNGDGTKGEDISRAQIVTLQQAHELLEFFKEEVPGFEESYIVHTGGVGIRETRRIKGEYVLQASDILNQIRFPDVVARGAFPIDLHQPNGDSLEFKRINKAYDIPFRCLLPKSLDNVLVAGRCISISHEALASTRITATCMAMGQAAGTAAALCVNGNKKLKDLDIDKLQNTLIHDGVILKKDRKSSV